MDTNKKICNLLCNDTCDYICGRPKPEKKKEIIFNDYENNSCNDSCDNTNNNSCDNCYNDLNLHMEHSNDKIDVLDIKNQIKEYFGDMDLYKEKKIKNHKNVSIPKITKDFYKLNIFISNELEKYSITESNYEVIEDGIYDFLSEFLKNYKEEEYIINIDGFDPLMLFYIKTKNIIDTIRNINKNIPIIVNSNCKLIDDNMLNYFKDNNILLSLKIKNHEINDSLFNKLSYMNKIYNIELIELDCKKDDNLLQNIVKLLSLGYKKMDLINCFHAKDLKEIIKLYLIENDFNVYILDNMLQYLFNPDMYNKNELFELFLTYDLKLYYTQYQNKIIFNDIFENNQPNSNCQNCSLFNMCKSNNIISNCDYKYVYDLLIQTINDLKC